MVRIVHSKVRIKQLESTSRTLQIYINRDREIVFEVNGHCVSVACFAWSFNQTSVPLKEYLLSKRLDRKLSLLFGS